MERALILIKTESPSETKVFDRVKSHPKVVEANMIYGPYDLYTVCEDNTTVGIKRTVLEIRNILGVVSTLTCLIAD